MSPDSPQADLNADRIGCPAASRPAAVTGAVPKYAQAAALVRAQVADGTLKPGQPAPSGAVLARLTGFSVLTCRRALRELITDGVFVPGLSPNARPRVPADNATPAIGAAAALSGALASRRRAAGIGQSALAALAGCSVTSIGHAETGRHWHSRDFWVQADVALAAGGELVRLHDAYRAGVTAEAADPAPAPPVVTRVTLHWSNGTTTAAYPPALPVPGRRPSRQRRARHQP
jgi:Helix-turn-helix domain/Bacterial regulatory proteins, gntR family